MSGNTFGKLFRVTTFGESHGSAMGCVVDGCPSGLALCAEEIQKELDRRKPGTTSLTSQRREPDSVHILSGVFEGKTTGAPIALHIQNTQIKSKDYDALKNVFRPGHGDFTYYHKYGVRDHRGGGRASARETAMWVAAGAIAKKYLFLTGEITINARLVQIGHLVNPSLEQIETLIKALRREGDSIGAKIQVIADNVPIGLGAPVFDKLDADLAKAFMGINAVKGVEIGCGFECVTKKGSECNDQLTAHGFATNNAGGILAGISTGQPIVATLAFKPTPSIVKPTTTLNTSGDIVGLSVTGRHDPCVGLRAVPIVEAMCALVLIDHWLLNKCYTDI